MCRSYEIYKAKVGGKTFDGKDMKQFEEMPENIQKAWKSIDEHYESIFRNLHKNVLSLLMGDFDKNFRQ